MKRIAIVAALALAAAPAFAQGVVVVQPAPGVVVAPPTANGGFQSNTPEPGIKAEVAGQAQAAGMGTPQVAPNGSSYVPSNRGVDPAAGYTAAPPPVVPVTR